MDFSAVCQIEVCGDGAKGQSIPVGMDRKCGGEATERERVERVKRPQRSLAGSRHSNEIDLFAPF